MCDDLHVIAVEESRVNFSLAGYGGIRIRRRKRSRWERDGTVQKVSSGLNITARRLDRYTNF